MSSIKDNPWLARDKAAQEKAAQEKKTTEPPKPKVLRDSPFGKKEEKEVEPIKPPQKLSSKPILKDNPFGQSKEIQPEEEQKTNKKVEISGPSVAERQKMLTGLNFDPKAQTKGPLKPKKEDEEKKDASDDSYISDDDDDSKPKKPKQHDADEYPTEKVDYKEMAAKNANFLNELKGKMKKPIESAEKGDDDEIDEAEIWGEKKPIEEDASKNADTGFRTRGVPLLMAAKQSEVEVEETTNEVQKKLPDEDEAPQTKTKELLSKLAQDEKNQEAKDENDDEDDEKKGTIKKKKIVFDDEEEDEVQKHVDKPAKKPKKKLFDDNDDDDI